MSTAVETTGTSHAAAPLDGKRIGLIWAQTVGGVIGNDNAIPWRVPEDMAFFREQTTGYAVIMGRRTWDSLPPRYRPLEGRRNIVITHDPDWSGAGAERAGSLDEALAATGAERVWIVGGAQIYRAAIGLATELLVTEIDADIDGDAHAPAIDASWRSEDVRDWQTSRGGPRYRIRRYTR